MTEVAKTARDIAVDALRDREGNVSAHLDRVLGSVALSPADRGFARELALGVVRRQGSLMAVVKAFLKQPGRDIASPIKEILLVALYQMIFLERVPDFAAVNEAVEQATRYQHPRQAGLVNGVLRNVAREMSPRQGGEIPLSSDTLPIAPRVYRTFQRAVLPDPQTKGGYYFSCAYSIPEGLANRWIDRFGMAKASALAMQGNVRAPMVFRVNRLRAKVSDVLAALELAGHKAVPHANGASVVLEEHANVAELEVFKQGLIQPQDPTATAVTIAADPKPNSKVLDFCAAPGTKTTHLAELMDNRGQIEAVDVSQAKLDLIQSNCHRLGVSIVRTRLAELAGSLPMRDFNLVLADVPCSNSGVLSRRAEARWRFDEKMMANLTRDQFTLASLAAEFVAPGGRLVYSTCSIEPEECQGMVRRLLGRNSRLSLVRDQLTLPGGAENPTQWCDGGYYAILRAK